MFSHTFSGLVISCVVLAAMAAPTDAAAKGGAMDMSQWTHTIELPRPDAKQGPVVGYYWSADNAKPVRGLIVAGKIVLEKRICTDAQVRAAAAEKGLGILYFEPHLDAVFDYVKRDSGQQLEKALAELARKTGHPEIEFAPVLTVGHSTGGIFCRNVAYWKPDRVIGVVHVKSGNFQDGIPDKSATLAGVPLIALNGEFEEYGPMGGDLKVGLRAEYSLNPTDKSKQNQTQWVMIRMQIMDRRRKNPENLMSLVVDRGQGHLHWDDALSALTAQFIRSAADARIPKEPGDGKSAVKCLPVKAESGWLSDPDIKEPKLKPAPFKEFQGDKKLAFWHLDKAMAEAVAKYHEAKWEMPDPTAGQPVEKRYYPPAILQDVIDLPATKP